MKKIEYFVTEHPDFRKDVKHLIKKKRFKSLPEQVIELEDALERGKFPGTLIRRIEEPKPYELYKLRLPNLDTKVGKSNGYRIIYIVVTEHRVVVILTIYI